MGGAAGPSRGHRGGHRLARHGAARPRPGRRPRPAGGHGRHQRRRHLRRGLLFPLSRSARTSIMTSTAETQRVLVPGGRLLLLDHIGSTWPPVYAAQWLAERITIRAAGEHFTRRQLPLVTAAGFQVMETERLKAGTVERIHAVKPA